MLRFPLALEEVEPLETVCVGIWGEDEECEGGGGGELFAGLLDADTVARALPRLAYLK